MADRADDFTLPELTRSLRALGSARWLGDADHARLFTPLLAARRNAARVRTAEGHVAAFQADRLRRTLAEAVEQMAAARHPRSAPDRRAFAARATDAGAAVWQTLDALERSAAAIANANDAFRRDAWADWVAHLRRLFLAADAWWLALVALRDGTRPLGGGPTAARSLIFVLLCAATPAVLMAQQHLTYRVTGLSPSALVARGFDVVGSEREGTLVVAAPRELARLQAFGVRTQVVTAAGTDPRRLMQLEAVSSAPVVYRPYDDATRGIRKWVDSMAANNARISVDTVGRSYEGRPILAVKIGPRGDSPSRPNVLFMAAHHAREWAATEMALRLIRYLATATDARTDSLVNQRDIWVVPVVNPDGYQYTFTTDRLWRKNRRPTVAGEIGVDLNRNHSTNWGLDEVGSSASPPSEIYRGPSPASEPEVSALQQFHAAHPPVVSISYHTYAGLYLFPPGSRVGVLAADIDAYRVLGGSNTHPPAIDHLPGSVRTFYGAGAAWLLYATNGEYTEWASTTYGAISLNPEISSGYGADGFYGFEFPDNEALLQQLFSDNLPLAVDAIEMARDPAAYRSPTTGLRAERWVLESGTSPLRVRGPAASVATSTLAAAGQRVTVAVDSSSGGRYARRLVEQSSGAARPASIVVTSATERVSWSLLAAAGAEAGDSTWILSGATRDTVQRYVGRASYHAAGNGEVRSPLIAVPSGSDTVSLTFWTRHDGDDFMETPFALVRVSTDSGRSWNTAARLAGTASTWYPLDVRIAGVHGKQVQLSFQSAALGWWIDEVALFANGASSAVAGGATTAASIRPSANPVRGSSVTFTWPYVGQSGRVRVYDFSGRLVWTHEVASGDVDMTWTLARDAVPNGAYLVLAESGGAHARLKLLVARGAP